MPNINRRKVLKGISLTGAVAITPMTLQAAKLTATDQPLAMVIDARHGRFKNSLSNEVINTGNQAIVLNSEFPVGHKISNGSTVELYIKSSQQHYTLRPGERATVYARAATTDNVTTILPNILSDQINVV